MSINIIAAIGLDNELGYKNKLLWDMPNDLSRFRELTRGHFVCMGRKTFESIGKPLPGRTNIILTRKNKIDFHPEIITYNSVESVLQEYHNHAEKDVDLWVIGGAKVYEKFLQHCDRIHLTIIHHKFTHVDALFPKFSLDDFRVVENVLNKKDSKHKYDYSFITYERRQEVK